MRDIRALPKAHLHLFLTGSMRLGTRHEFAATYQIALPPALRTTSVNWADTDRDRSVFRFVTTPPATPSVRRTTCAGWFARQPRMTLAGIEPKQAGRWRAGSAHRWTAGSLLRKIKVSKVGDPGAIDAADAL